MIDDGSREGSRGLSDPRINALDKLVGQDVHEYGPGDRVGSQDLPPDILHMLLSLGSDGGMHLLQEDIDNLVVVVELVLAKVEEGDECLVNGREVSCHSSVAVAHVELPGQR